MTPRYRFCAKRQKEGQHRNCQVAPYILALSGFEIRRSGATFKDALNRYLRLGLAAAKQPPRKKFKVKPRMLGLPPGLSYDKVEELIEALEGPYHR